MFDLEKGWLWRLLLINSVFALPVSAQFYFQNFDGVPGFRISDAGFKGQYWKLDTAEGNKFMRSASPGGLFKMGVALSPRFPFVADREAERGFTVQFQLRFPGTWEANPAQSAWGKNNTTSMDLIGTTGRPLFTVTFQPNRKAGLTRPNLFLTNWRTGKTRSAPTGTVTPFGLEERSGTVNLRLVFRPAAEGDSGIQVFYGENGESPDTPAIVDNYKGAVHANRMKFRYFTGTSPRNYSVRVDEILVRPNLRVVLPTTPDNGFDRPLFASDGTNTTDVFGTEDYYQGTFRLARSTVAPGLLPEWDSFQEGLRFIEEAAVDIQGLPLLISKSDFTAVIPGAAPQSRTFFMSSFSKSAVISQDITILTSPAFQATDDRVTSIRLELDGQVLDLPLAGNTPFRFASFGEKTAKVTVTFAEGFVGTNNFRVTATSGPVVDE